MKKKHSPLPGQSRKRPVRVILIALLLSLLLGYAAGLCWEYYNPRHEWNMLILRCLRHPNAWTSKTRMGIIGGGIVWLMLMMHLGAESHYNRLPGKEYGQARFIDADEANVVLEDPEEEQNRILAENLRMSIDGKRTGLNSNTLVIGGSGSGKSWRYVRPNILQRNASYVITDPKSELYGDLSGFLAFYGYRIRVLNLIDMQASDHYNPFVYLKKPTDVLQLITNLIANTTPAESHTGDPFWEHAEFLYLSSLFFYVWLAPQMEGQRHIGSVMQLMEEAKIPENEKEQSALDKRMAELEAAEWIDEYSVPGDASVRQGKEHPAVKSYNKFRVGAVDTTRSIIISSNARLSAWANAPDLLELLSSDEMHIAELGMGYQGHLQKTALFCIIPDSDTTFNSVAGMFYTQLFQILYDQADNHTENRCLPIPVHIYLDEFANIALPKNFLNNLSTMRSRNIACPGIMIQDLARIKKMFSDGAWEALPSNCDTLVYLGSNEQSTHKYISELLGKWTVDKRSYGESKGSTGNASTNDDVIGRELMTPDEIRMLNNSQEIILVRGMYPIMDEKYNVADDPRYQEAKQIPAYDKNQSIGAGDMQMFGALSDTEESYMKTQGYGVLTLSANELFSMPDTTIMPDAQPEYNMQLAYSILKSELQMERRQEAEWQAIIQKSDTAQQETIKDRLLSAEYTDAQIREAELGLQNGLSEAKVLDYFQPEFSAARMRMLREMMERQHTIEVEENGKNES